MLQAYGPIYSLSADVASLVALRNNRQFIHIFTYHIHICSIRYLCVTVLLNILSISFRMFSNEDVTIGAWMLAMNVNHEENHQLCQTECTPTSIAVWDLPKCLG